MPLLLTGLEGGQYWHFALKRHSQNILYIRKLRQKRCFYYAEIRLRNQVIEIQCFGIEQLRQSGCYDQYNQDQRQYSQQVEEQNILLLQEGQFAEPHTSENVLRKKGGGKQPMNQRDIQEAQRIWNVPGASIPHIVNSSDKFRMKHGMFASVPIICGGYECPYFETCTIDPQLRIKGSRCAMEISAIMARYEMWCEHFNIDLEGTSILKEDMTDASLVRDLVDNEIQTLRAENKIALSGDFIGKTLKEVDRQGKAYYEDAVTPAAEYKMTLLDKRYKIMQLLNSTRKDKASQLSRNESLGIKAIGLLESVKSKLNGIDLNDIPSEESTEEV